MWVCSRHCLFAYMHVCTPLLASVNIHHHQPINVPTAGAQAFLMDST
jgi:hypothetical protein